MVELTSEQFAAARVRGDARLAAPRAEHAHYDAGRDRVIIRLTTGLELGFAPQDVEPLRAATAEDLRVIEVEAFGLGVHFPTLDADLYVPALLDGTINSGKRGIAQGSKRVHRYVVERSVDEQVRLRNETTAVYRHPGRAVTADDFTDHTITMAKTEEMTVVARSARDVGEAVLHKDVNRNAGTAGGAAHEKVR